MRVIMVTMVLTIYLMVLTMDCTTDLIMDHIMAHMKWTAIHPGCIVTPTSCIIIIRICGVLMDSGTTGALLVLLIRDTAAHLIQAILEDLEVISQAMVPIFQDTVLISQEWVPLGVSSEHWDVTKEKRSYGN